MFLREERERVGSGDGRGSEQRLPTRRGAAPREEGDERQASGKDLRAADAVGNDLGIGWTANSAPASPAAGGDSPRLAASATTRAVTAAWPRTLTRWYPNGRSA